MAELKDAPKFLIKAIKASGTPVKSGPKKNEIMRQLGQVKPKAAR